MYLTSLGVSFVRLGLSKWRKESRQFGRQIFNGPLTPGTPAIRRIPAVTALRTSTSPAGAQVRDCRLRKTEAAATLMETRPQLVVPPAAVGREDGNFIFQAQLAAQGLVAPAALLTHF